MNDLAAPALAALFAFLTAGFCFAAVRRRQTGDSYLLFWRNPMSPRARAVLGHGFVRGPLGDIWRIALFALATLIAVVAVFDR